MFHANTSTYRTNANGEVLTGKQIIDGKEYIFALKGQVLDGIIGYDSKLYLVTDSKIEKTILEPFFKKKHFGAGLVSLESMELIKTVSSSRASNEVRWLPSLLPTKGGKY